jgi:methylthioribose-1-phosphate isomerase
MRSPAACSTGKTAVNVRGKPMRTIWLGDGSAEAPVVEIIDQTRLPHELVIVRLATLDDAARAIRDMQVRGAPLIGAAAAYGMALAAAADPSDRAIDAAAVALAATRPTAVNLAWALGEMRGTLGRLPPRERLAAALARAGAIADEDVAINRAIGEHGLAAIWAAFAAKPGDARVQILTHCNAGWLATVDWGTALAPVTPASRCTSGSTRRGRATRAPA